MGYIEIILTKKDKKTNRKQIDKCLITDNLSVTRYSDPNQSFNVYQEKRKDKKQNVSWARGVLTEEYPEMKAEEILKMTVEQLDALKEKMKKEMEIKYTITHK